MLEISDAAGSALVQLFGLERLAYLFLGVLLGLVLGAIPGLGGLIAIAILLPFTFTLDAATSIALIMGIASVGTISDTIPAVLFAVPGTTGSQATVLDGYPLSRRGEAGRALGAAYFSNVLGGLMGAMLLMVAVFVLQPLLRHIGSPEIFALTIFGISTVGVLSKGAMFRGLAMGFAGLAIATVGQGPGLATLRFTFGQLYLWDGVSIIGMTLGLFGMVEIADLAISRTSIASDVSKVNLSPLQGIKDVLHNKFLLIRTSALGIFLGAIPGIGETVIDWLAYGHALQSEKNTQGFGKGDIRGVIAPEAANNAKQGGQAIPTLAFGIPGGLTWALVLMALLIQGIQPGPVLFEEHLDIVFIIGWSIALANVFGVALVLLMTPLFARISLVPPHVLAPVAMVVMLLASYQVTSNWGDLFTVLIFFILGWLMKRTGWPRPPLLIGLVLGTVVESYGITTFGRFGLSALLRPGVIIILLITLAFVLGNARAQDRTQPFENRGEGEAEPGEGKDELLEER